MNFINWLNTLIEEKEIDTRDCFEIEKNGELHIFDYGYIVEAIKFAPAPEQNAIQKMLIKIDFANGDILHYFRHLAQALC